MHNFWHSMLNCYMPKVVALSLCVDRRKIAKLNIKFSTIVETENRNAYFYIIKMCDKKLGAKLLPLQVSSITLTLCEFELIIIEISRMKSYSMNMVHMFNFRICAIIKKLI